MRVVPAALGAVLVFAAPAHGQLQDSWRASAGVEKARDAGITIDAATAAAMARAPVGSCPNDPTQVRCPEFHKITTGGSVWAPDDGEIVVTETGKTRLRQSRGVRGRLAQLPAMCQMYWNSDNPYKAAGYAQMNVSAYCGPAASALEVYGSLHKRYQMTWYQMAMRARRGAGGETVRIHTTYDCTDNPRRYWRANGEGWALVAGGWHYRERIAYDYLYCG